MSAYQRNKLYWGLVLVSINLLVFISLFTLTELSYRIYRDGLREAFVKLANTFLDVPYSSIGTANWVISDSELGYRLNPNHDGVNSLSIRHEEIVVPKPRNTFRLIFLGDSVSFDRPGFVSYTRDMLRKEGSIEAINASVPGYTTYQELVFSKNICCPPLPTFSS